ncbi:Dihydropteroate synthase [Alphaproteobacteria bacterium]
MTKLIGILNYTLNSFSDGANFFSNEKALRQIRKLFTDGADVVDIGAIATSYGARLLTTAEEWQRLYPLLHQCASEKVSIDTFYAETAKKAAELGIGYINDPSGGKDPKMLEIIAAYPNIKYIFMFSFVLPADRDTKVEHRDEIFEWGEKKIRECLSCGIQKNQLIFDPGIGFATSAEQSFEVIKNIEEYRKLGIPVCVGHSRKSFFNLISSFAPEERDIETLSASIYMLMRNVDYLRVHNVAWHQRAFKVLQRL